MFRSKRKRNLKKITCFFVLLFGKYGDEIKEDEMDMTKHTQNLVGVIKEETT